MATTISTPQLAQLNIEFQNASLRPKVIAERLVQEAPVVFAIPFNTDAMPLNITNAASGLLKPSSSQSIISKCNSTGKTATSVTAGTGLTLHTVTGGKKFYLTHFSIQTITLQGIELRDGGSSGTLLFATRQIAAGSGTSYSFPTPIEFSTDVWFDLQTTEGVHWHISGFEE